MTRNSYPSVAVVGMILALSACGGGGHHTQGIVVVINDKITTIAPGAAVVVVTVTTNDAAGVTFKIAAGGTDCQPACGTLSNTTSGSVDYTPPASVPAAPNNAPTITATSVTDTSRFDTDSFTIQNSVTNLPLLNGQYAFVVSGFDANGFALAMAGSFTANGSGMITGGEMDVNDEGALGTNGSALAGTYTLDQNLRGVITFTNAVTQLTNPPAFSFTVDSTGATGDLMSLDANDFATSGFLQKQQLAQPGAAIAKMASAGGRVPDGAPVTPGAPAGNFIFRTSWADPGTSVSLPVDTVGIVGRITINSDGSVSNGLVDASDIFNGPFSVETATGASTAPDADGRGTLTLTVTEEGTIKFAYYEISPQKFYLLEIDPGSRGTVSVHSGEARAQQDLPFAGGAADGTSVFGLIGANSDFETPATSAAIGQLVISGASATATTDLNDLEFVTSNVVSDGGTVTFDLNTGRGTITFPGGFGDGFVDSVVFYLESSSKGVMLDTTDVGELTLNEALVGDFLPQASGPFDKSFVNGNLMAVNIATDPAPGGSVPIPVVVSALTADSANTSVTGLANVAFAGSPPLTNQEVSASYSGIDSTTGRGDAVVPAAVFGGASGNVDASFYLVGSNQFFLIGLDDGTDVIETSLGVFDPVGTLPAPAATLSTRNSGNVPRAAGGVRHQARLARRPLVRAHARVTTAKR
jgi:hypothetical protein